MRSRDEAARQSRNSTLSGQPLSEEGSAEGTPDLNLLTEKEKAERLREQERQIIVKAKLNEDRVQARKDKISAIQFDRD